MQCGEPVIFGSVILILTHATCGLAPTFHFVIAAQCSMDQTVYEAAGGRKAFVDLAHAWHARCLADPVVSHAFSHGFHPQHAERLAAYWAQALGGPADYTASIGDETFVVG